MTKIFTTLILAGLVLSGCVYGSVKTEEVDVSDEKVVEEVDVVNDEPEVISSDVDTSDWKTYRNEKYGFEIKYPGEWGDVNIGEIEKSEYVSGQKYTLKFSNSSWGKSQGYKTPFVEIQSSGYKFSGPADGVGINFSKIDFKKTDEDLAELLERPSSLDFKVEKIVTDGVQGLHIQELDKSLLDGELREFEYYIYPQYKNNSYLNIYIIDDASDLLSVFIGNMKFLDQELEVINSDFDASEWAYYENNLYNYSLKIPFGFKNNSEYDESEIELKSDLRYPLNLGDVNNESVVKFIPLERFTEYGDERETRDNYMAWFDRADFVLYQVNGIDFKKKISDDYGDSFLLSNDSDYYFQIIFYNINKETIDAFLANIDLM